MLRLGGGIATRHAEFVALGLIIAGTVNPFVYGEVINITDSSVVCIAVGTVPNEAKGVVEADILDCSISFVWSKQSKDPLLKWFDDTSCCSL